MALQRFDCTFGYNLAAFHVNQFLKEVNFDEEKIAEKMQRDFLGVQFKSTKLRKLFPKLKKDILKAIEKKDEDSSTTKAEMDAFLGSLWKGETSVVHPFTGTLKAMRDADSLMGTPPEIDTSRPYKKSALM